MSLAHEASVVFDYPDVVTAKTIRDAIELEVGEINSDRSRATVERSGTSVVVRVAARDLVALRAAANTWIGLVDVAERTRRVADIARE